MPVYDPYRALAQPLNLGGTGLQVAVKECIDIAGLATRCGSFALAASAPAADHARVVELLLEGGCRIVGTTVMHELAFGVTGINRSCGTAINPRWPDRIVGGSSSGSAAIVAAGACDFALGTDTGGSVRLPACCCSVYGLKSTRGLISRAGVSPKDSSLDCIGVFAASADAVAEAMTILAPSFALRTLFAPPRFKRVQVVADRDVSEALETYLDGLPAPLVELASFEAAFSAGLSVMNAETWTAYGPLLESGRLGNDVVARLETARDIGPIQLERAEEIRARFTAEVDAALQDADVLVLPTMSSVPPLISSLGDSSVTLRLTSLLRPFNLSGHPALTIPALTASGLPAGVQLVGRRGDDALLCGVAQWLARRRPRGAVAA